MDIKKDVSEKIQKIMKNEGNIGDKIVDFVHDDYEKRLKDSEQAGQTSKHATQQIISGIAEGLKAGGHQIEDLGLMVADAVVDISSDIASQSLGVVTSYTEDAIHLLNKKNETETSSEAEDGFDKKVQEQVKLSNEELQNNIFKEKMRHSQVLEGLLAYAEDPQEFVSEAYKKQFKEAVKRGEKNWSALEREVNNKV